MEAQDKVIAEQGGQISDMVKEMQVMKRMMIEAGLNSVTSIEVEPSKESFSTSSDHTLVEDIELDQARLAKIFEYHALKKFYYDL